MLGLLRNERTSASLKCASADIHAKGTKTGLQAQGETGSMSGRRQSY